MTHTRPALLVLMIVLGASSLVAACGGDGGSSAGQVLEPATLVPGEELPAVADPTLVLDGAVADGEVVLDVATIEELEEVEAVLYEPFERRDMRFSGVRVRDLLEIAGADAGASGIHMHALDDYTADFTLDQLRGDDVLLATRIDGEPIPLDHGGPTRIVFLDGSSVGRNADLWIWSLDRITVR